MTYAVIETGSHQFRVEAGQRLKVELLGDSKPGKGVVFDKVLFVADEGKEPAIGRPCVKGAKVTAEVLGEVPGPKVVNFRFKRRKNYSRKKGHRQNYTEVKILEVRHGA